jgi:hypothetical protein
MNVTFRQLSLSKDRGKTTSLVRTYATKSGRNFDDCLKSVQEEAEDQNDSV